MSEPTNTNSSWQPPEDGRSRAFSFPKPEIQIREPLDPLIGQILFGNFKVLEKLGQGEMAIVYLAKYCMFDELVAMKTVRVQDPEIMKRFSREVKTHSRLRHPNIVDPIVCLETPLGQPFFIMEYLEGVSLEQLLSLHGRMEREDELAEILTQICFALEHAHGQKVVHRDMKPENIVITRSDDEMTVKVLDFGLATLEQEMQKLTREGQVMGSPVYMSPEQCLGAPLTGSSDIYSLGIIAYELITGEVPYNGSSPMEVMQAHCEPGVRPRSFSEHDLKIRCPEMLEDVIFRALDKEPTNRYKRAKDFRRAIEEWRAAATGMNSEAQATDTTTDLNTTTTGEHQTTSIWDVVAIKSQEIEHQKKRLLESADSVVTSVVTQTTSSVLFKVGMFCLIGGVLSAVVALIIIMNLENMQRGFTDASGGGNKAIEKNADSAPQK
jgi:Serine/threonine protein kinase